MDRCSVERRMVAIGCHRGWSATGLIDSIHAFILPSCPSRHLAPLSHHSRVLQLITMLSLRARDKINRGSVYDLERESVEAATESKRALSLPGEPSIFHSTDMWHSASTTQCVHSLLRIMTQRNIHPCDGYIAKQADIDTCDTWWKTLDLASLMLINQADLRLETKPEGGLAVNSSDQVEAILQY